MTPFPSLSGRRALLRAALRAVAGARRVVLGRLRRGLRASLKSDRSWVTDADRAAERHLRGELGRRFPDHGIVGEELGTVRSGADFQWIMDPIDGTLSFVKGIPLYGIILALHHRGRPVLGVMDHPGLEETCYAGAGLGAYRDGRRLLLADLPPGSAVASEIVATGDRAHFIRCGRQADFDRLLARHPQVRSYADCFGHTLAARGAVGAMVDFGVKIWDIAATEILVSEAGGRFEVVGRWPAPGGDVFAVVFGKPRVVDWLLRLFRNADDGRA